MMAACDKRICGGCGKLVPEAPGYCILCGDGADDRVMITSVSVWYNKLTGGILICREAPNSEPLLPLPLSEHAGEHKSQTDTLQVR